MSKSIGSMIQQLAGLIGTKDLSDWESQFVASVAEKSANGNATQRLTSKQAEKISQIYGEHFGDAEAA